MLKLISRIASSIAVTSLVLSGAITIAQAQDKAQAFDAAGAFCDRQTFTLENMAEVRPWLDYFSGLRNGRSTPPDDGCASSSIRAIVNITQSKDIATFEGLRAGFLSFYMSRSMDLELGDRLVDRDGSFRYRNDIVLASFLWLLCPGHGEQRLTCVKKIVNDLPSEFLRTSPVFCDFKPLERTKVEWPPLPEISPLVCATGGKSNKNELKSWIRDAQITLGD